MYLHLKHWVNANPLLFTKFMNVKVSITLVTSEWGTQYVHYYSDYCYILIHTFKHRNVNDAMPKHMRIPEKDMVKQSVT